MALTKAQLEALKNTLLASGQPIDAARHRSFVQNVIDEMYDAQSRGDLMAGVQADTVTETGDVILLIRSGRAYLVPASLFGGGTASLTGLSDVIISDAQEQDVLSYDVLTDKWVNRAVGDLYPAAQYRESNTILFNGDYISGINAAALSGNIFFDFTGARLGATAQIQHLDAGAFTFPPQAVLMFDPSLVSTSAANYFLLVLVGSTPGSEIVHVFHAMEGGV